MLGLYVAYEGLGKEIDGAVWTAAFFFFCAWSVFGLVIYFSEWWDTRPKISVALTIAIGVFLCFFWWVYLPKPPQPEIVKIPVSSAPSTPEATPSLSIRLGGGFARYNISLDLTEVLLQVEIRNAGAPSAVTNWAIHYSSPTLEKDLRPVQPVSSPMVFPLSRRNDVGLVFDYPRDAINEKVAVAPITKEVPVRGRLLLNLPGDRAEELSRGRLSVSIFDYLGKRSTDFYKAGVDRSATGILLPGEKMRPLTKEEKRRIHK